MPQLHFLNVKNGDCSIIRHGSGRVTMIDVNNARVETTVQKAARETLDVLAKASGNYRQKGRPENPIAYMQDRGIDSIFRFILTHPDMDHMDGIADVFKAFSPPNFWDTENSCNKDSDDWGNAPYREEDWEFYRKMRDGRSNGSKRLVYLSGQTPCDFWNEDGLRILAPSQNLIDDANACEEWNDSSYVVRYSVKNPGGGPNFVAILAGDSHDSTWEHILAEHSDAVRNVDLLLAPHHGRHSERDFSFLDTLRPKLTLFGNAASEHLAYNAWYTRDLRVVTNNQAGSVIVDFSSSGGSGPYYVTNEGFARQCLGDHTYFDDEIKGWLCGFLR